MLETSVHSLSNDVVIFQIEVAVYEEFANINHNFAFLNFASSRHMPTISKRWSYYF